jgi:hypothetical protein
MNITKIDYKEQLLEQLRTIDSDELKSDFELIASSAVIEEQKIYFWIRLYLSEEDPNIQIGDEITIEWTPSGEKLDTKFIVYGKSGLERDHEGEVTNYNPEDDIPVFHLHFHEGTLSIQQKIH